VRGVPVPLGVVAAVIPTLRKLRARVGAPPQWRRLPPPSAPGRIVYAYGSSGIPRSSGPHRPQVLTALAALAALGG
jgi:hypothetical protein